MDKKAQALIRLLEKKTGKKVVLKEDHTFDIKHYRVTYEDGGVKEATGYNIEQAITSVEGMDFVVKVELV